MNPIFSYTRINAAQTDLIDTGNLRVTALSEQNVPIENAAVDISYTGDPDSILEEVHTDSSGQTDILSLNAPPVEYSLSPCLSLCLTPSIRCVSQLPVMSRS